MSLMWSILCLRLSLAIYFVISGQAIWRKVQNLGMATSYIKMSKVRMYVWHILSMAHVPIRDHEAGLQVIEDDLRGFEDDSDSNPGAMRLLTDARDLFR